MSEKNSFPKPPETYRKFMEEFPELGKAWETIAQAGNNGPLDEKTIRLIKLGISMGAMREGAVHSGVRKAKAVGITPEEIRQVISLAAGTMGMPSTVALYSWAKDEMEK